MPQEDLIALWITIGVGLLLIALACVLLSGRGAFLISGYNMLPKAEKAKWNEKALCRFMGKILLLIGVGLPLPAIGAIYDIPWLPTVCLLALIAVVVVALVYPNASGKFKNEP